MSSQLIPENEFQTVVPSNDGTLTVRTLNTSSPSNNNLLAAYSISPIKIIPVQSYSQGQCLSNINDDALIATKDDLFIYLCDVLIRFDTNPNYYQKEDYTALLRMLVGSLLHLYNNSITSSNPVSYKIIESPKVLNQIIPTGHLIKNILVYNNEEFSVTMNLGYSIDEQELLLSEEIPSKGWITLSVEKLLSMTSSSSLYFDCAETLTANGIYVIVDSNLYLSI